MVHRVAESDTTEQLNFYFHYTYGVVPVGDMTEQLNHHHQTILESWWFRWGKILVFVLKQ